MRISDWSSDVCSSDLYRRAKGTPLHDGARLIGHAPLRCARRREGGARPEARAAQSISYSEVSGGDQLRFLKRDRKRVVSGKRVSVSVAVGGRLLIKKKRKRI